MKLVLIWDLMILILIVVRAFTMEKNLYAKYTLTGTLWGYLAVHTHEGPILALIYLWYTNTEYSGRKNKINAFVHSRTF